MGKTIIKRLIKAPVEKVFNAVADTNQFAEAIPHVQKIEILSEVKTGVGVRFRETRLIKGKEASTELEVTEYVENERIRLVTDSHGTVWDSLFTVESKDGGTQLTLVMEARAHKLMASLMTSVMKGVIKSTIEADIDSLKAYCEK